MTAHDPPHGRLVTSMRFYRLPDVAEIFNISDAQAYALVRTGELPAIKVGGRGQWRVERSGYVRVSPGGTETQQVSELMTRSQRALVGCEE